MQLKYYLSVGLAVCASAQVDAGSMNLTSLIASNQNLTGLATLLGAYPSLAATVASAPNITILAPSNDALMALNSSGALAQAASIPGYVEALLSYHVLQGTIFAENITSTPAFPATLLNNTAYDNVTGGQVIEAVQQNGSVYIYSGLKNNASVVQADLGYNNGVVHIIDSVLTIPVNASSTAMGAGLTDLLGAVVKANLTSAIDTTPDLTIFAPSNAAFEAISSSVGNLSVEQLTSILEYHVIAGTVAYSSTLANGTVPTLGGGNVTITISDGAVFVNSARVVIADVLIANGVVHVIDSVLNPNNTATANGTQTSPATAYTAASGASSVALSSIFTQSATTTLPGFQSSASAVASGATATGGRAAATSTGAAGLVLPNGAIGAAALFGGAVLVAGL